MDKTELRDTILTHIAPVRIPDTVFRADALGVIPGLSGLQTDALQRAIDTVSVRGGGRLSLLPGIYRTGALQLKSRVELHLEQGAVLRFTAEDPEKNYPLRYSHWEASPCWNFSALLYAREAEDIAVTGPGLLDGGADPDHWWNWHHQVETAWSENLPDLQLPDRKALREMNVNAVPVSDRIFGGGHFLRPNFIQFLNCRRVLLRDFTLKNSPMWQLNPVFCSAVTVDGVTLSSHGPNNDGCDPESCDGVWIKNCRFDTGDDCISLKSGRDRDGRQADTPCQNVLIEDNDFADGHGGIALGSEMSGGIRRVLAARNRFSSPRLTYALRMKTNARRGGFIEQVMLCESVMDHVHGAAVHGTMLYEDGRNGNDLPVFRDIVIEDITAHGGDYGIFLEAFPERPITGLVLRNIAIDGVERELRSMNWADPVVENVSINGKRYPRPGKVRILGTPVLGRPVEAWAESCGGRVEFRFTWYISKDGTLWKPAGEGGRFVTPDTGWLRLRAEDAAGNREESRPYRVLDGMEADRAGTVKARLACRGLLGDLGALPGNALVTRRQAAGMLRGLAEKALAGAVPVDTEDPACLLAAANGYFALDREGRFRPDERFTRQELATVAMQACGINYRNASTTMPVCRDAAEVWNSFGTNAARALYFGFLELEEGYFYPLREVTAEELCRTLDRVADFAGL